MDLCINLLWGNPNVQNETLIGLPWMKEGGGGDYFIFVNHLFNFSVIAKIVSQLYILSYAITVMGALTEWSQLELR